MKIICCGGRSYSDRARVFAVLDAMHGGNVQAVESVIGAAEAALWEAAGGGSIRCVVHGAARGLDLLSEAWAKDRQVPYRGYPAPWSTHGEWCRCSHPLPDYCRGAGSWRNGFMLRAERPVPSLVVAFPGNVGTRDMVRRARAAEVSAIEVRP